MKSGIDPYHRLGERRLSSAPRPVSIRPAGDPAAIGARDDAQEAAHSASVTSRFRETGLLKYSNARLSHFRRTHMSQSRDPDPILK